MDYFLSEQQKEIKALARRIAEERILPVRAELDEKEEFPWDIMKALADSDMFRIFVPEAYEGLGGGCLDLCLVIEELSRICSGIALCYAATSLGTVAEDADIRLHRVQGCGVALESLELLEE